MESSYQKFAKDVLVIGVTSALVSLSGIFSLPLITKWLGSYDYGIWTQFNITISLISTIIYLGLPFALTRFLAAKTNKEEIQEEFYSVLAFVFFTSLIISSLVIIFAAPIAKAFFDGATQIVRITGFVTLVWSLNWVFLSLFRSFRQMKRYSIFMIADCYGQIGLIAYLVLNGHGILSMVLAVLAIRVVVFFILFFLIKQQIGIRIPHFSRIREYLSFGLPAVPGSISAWVIGSSDRYVIGYFLGAASVGIYSAGYNLGSLMIMPAAILGFVLPPTLSKLYDEGRMNEVKTHLSYSLKYSLAIAIPFVFGAAILSQPVLRLFSTPEIASQGYLILPIVALSILVFAFGSVINHIIILVKKTKISGAAWTIAAVVNLGLNILVVPRIGILGAAITTLFTYLMAEGILIYYSFKEFKFSIDWHFIIKSLIASAIMSLAVWSMHPESHLATVTTVVVGVVIYGVVLFLLRGFKKEEFKFFRTLFQKT